MLRSLYLVLEATAVVRLLGALAHLAAPSPRHTLDPNLGPNPTASTASPYQWYAWCADEAVRLLLLAAGVAVFAVYCAARAAQLRGLGARPADGARLLGITGRRGGGRSTTARVAAAAVGRRSTPLLVRAVLAYYALAFALLCGAQWALPSLALFSTANLRAVGVGAAKSTSTTFSQWTTDPHWWNTQWWNTKWWDTVWDTATASAAGVSPSRLFELVVAMPAREELLFRGLILSSLSSASAASAASAASSASSSSSVSSVSSASSVFSTGPGCAASLAAPQRATVQAIVMSGGLFAGIHLVNLVQSPFTSGCVVCREASTEATYREKQEKREARRRDGGERGEEKRREYSSRRDVERSNEKREEKKRYLCDHIRHVMCNGIMISVIMDITVSL